MLDPELNKELAPLDQLGTAVTKAQEGLDLLEEIWLEVGPYDRTYSEAIRSKLQRYFHFDDSE